ncbi:MAG: lipopolysaccharide heptosyltransferase II [Deltaproteobacteria bacterium]|nr:lipopolysaccharide heptosyltransferase II [Deltaproteobacteria bacterium]
MSRRLQDQARVRKILVRSANWVGDAVMSLPAVSALRRNFPQAEIYLLAKPWVADVFSACPDIDGVLIYESPGIHGGLAGKWRLARELKGRGFDLAFLIQNAFEAALISYLARIPRRIGYGTDGRSFLLTHPVKVDGRVKAGHQVDYYLGLLRGIGLGADSREPSLFLSPEKKEEAGRFLKSLGMEEELLIGLAPGATYGPAKQWPAERFAEVADRLAEAMKARILIFGSKGDGNVAGQVLRKARRPLADLTGRTTLAQAMALIGRCRLLVTNDSGLMHVAAALRVPVVAIFGSTDPRRTGPRGPAGKVIFKSVPCAPCFRTACPENLACLHLISVEEVFREAVDMLAGRVS